MVDLAARILVQASIEREQVHADARREAEAVVEAFETSARATSSQLNNAPVVITSVLEHVELLLTRVLGLELQNEADTRIRRARVELQEHIQEAVSLKEDNVSRREIAFLNENEKNGATAAQEGRTL